MNSTEKEKERDRKGGDERHHLPRRRHPATHRCLYCLLADEEEADEVEQPRLVCTTHVSVMTPCLPLQGYSTTTAVLQCCFHYTLQYTILQSWSLIDRVDTI